MSVRKFTLINSVGSQYNLNDTDNFGYDPTGLGLSMVNEYIGANAHFISTGQAIEQGKFAINLMFGAESTLPYEVFKSFVDFLNYPPFTLKYDIPQVGEYFRDCILSSIDKTELNEWNVLDQPIEFDFLTPYYRTINLQRSGDPLVTGYRGKGYYMPQGSINGRYVYDYVYGDYYGNSGAPNSFSVNNESLYMTDKIGSPCKISVYGACYNPSWAVYRGSEMIQSDGYFIDVPQGYHLEISSYPQDQYCVMVTPAGERINIYQQQDLTKSNFITIPQGNSSIVFDTGNQRVKLLVEYHEERLLI